MDKASQENTVIYSPKELKEKAIGLLNTQDFAFRRVQVAGRYVRRRKDEGASAYYDSIEADGATMTVVFNENNNTLHLRDGLADNQTVTVTGKLRLSEFNDQITLNLYAEEVNGCSAVRTVGTEEYRCIELLRTKIRKGRRTLPDFSRIEAGGRKPKVFLVLPKDSQAEGDIDSKLKGYEDRIIIERRYVSFFKAEEVADAVTIADRMGYDIIAVSRGGGDIKSLERLDRAVLLQVLVNMDTPFVAAIGHTADRLYIKDIADYTCDVPNDLGAWLVNRFDNNSTESGAAPVHDKDYKALKKKYDEQYEFGQRVLDKYNEIYEEHKNCIAELNNFKKEYIRLVQENKDMAGKNKSLLDAMPLLQDRPVVVQWVIIILAVIGLFHLFFK